MTLGAAYLRPDRLKQWVVFGLAALLPLIATDLLFFVYMGRPFAWSMGTYGNLFRLSGINPEPNTNGLWMVEGIVNSNGAIPSIFLFAALLAPFAVRHNKTALLIAISSLGVAVAFTVQGIMGRGILLTKVFAPFYPFWAVCASIAVGWALDRINTRTRPGKLAVTTIAAVLAVNTFQASIFVRGITQTLYPEIEQAFARAAREKRPVIYRGNQIYAALFFARAYGVETLTDPSDNFGNEGAVLVFEGENVLSNHAETEYEISTFSNFISSTQYPSLIEAALMQAGYVSHIEVWWPSEPVSPIAYSGPKSFPTQYYDGLNCITLPMYGNGSMHFYQLVWHKFITLFKSN